MTVFIDRPLWPSRDPHGSAGSAPDGSRGGSVPPQAGHPARGGPARLWSHLVSDVSYEELHAFAARLGLPRRAFERDHYDVPAELYDAAIALGATPVGAQELVARLNASGLRRRKHAARTRAEWTGEERARPRGE